VDIQDGLEVEGIERFPAIVTHLRRRIFALETVIEAKSAAALRSRHDCRSPAQKDAALPESEMGVGFLRPSAPIAPLNDAPHRPAARNRRSRLA
jgi:hypothetical protein